MRFAALILSFALHAVFLTWLFLHKPDVKPIISEPETQIELTPQTSPAPSIAAPKSAEKNPETAVSSNPNSSSSAVADKAISSNDALSQHTETGVATKPAQSNSTAISTASPAASTSTKTATIASSSSTTLSSSPISNAPAASLAPKLNRPITKELKCSPTADAQNVRGQVSVNVQINKFGQVKSSSILSGKGNIINELALSQAKLLHFPTMHNADNVEVESFSDVLFTFDCSRN